MVKTFHFGAKLLTFAFVFVLLSCAKGVDEESFDRLVTNSQLSSPDIEKFVVTSQTNADGTESCVLEWAEVPGASRYLCEVNIVDDPANPQPINIKGKAQEGVGPIEIDGTRIIFEKKEDTKYEVKIKTLGDKKLNNTDAAEPTLFAYSTMLAAITVPAGEEISAFINNYITTNYETLKAEYDKDPANYELAFELENGQTYELNDSVGFDIFPVTFRGSKATRPIVNVGEKGRIVTQAGIKIKWINFDCTNMKAKGLLTTSSVADEAFSTESLGYKALGANQNCYVIVRTMMFQECFVKNLANGLIHGGDDGAVWNIKDFRVTDCIIQQCNPTGKSNSLFNMWRQSGGASGFKDMTLKNTTFINTEKSDGYLMRFAHNSSSLPAKVYGTGEKCNFSFQNCTFIQTTTAGPLANMVPNQASQVTISLKKNIFYDTWRVQKFVQNNTADFAVGDNTIWGITNTVDNTDKEKYATEEDPMFADATIKELDLTQPNGGYNFKPTSDIAGGKQYGDPRWFE